MESSIIILKERFVNRSVLGIIITDLYNYFIKGLYYKDNSSIDYIDLLFYLS
jgi:hypothetical protein